MQEDQGGGHRVNTMKKVVSPGEAETQHEKGPIRFSKVCFRAG